MTHDAGAEAHPFEQLTQSDWTDQDLLTKDEARERLILEIDCTRARLDATVNDGDTGERTLLLRRLSAMESIRDDYAGPRDRT